MSAPRHAGSRRTFRERRSAPTRPSRSWSGTEVWVKHENHLPTAAFKVRGGVNLVAQLSAEERGGGLVSASTGNHGQSIAYAARLFDVRATICVPEGANQLKVAAIRALGAEIVVHGADFDDAREHCERLAAEHGYRYVHSGNEPHLIAGVATATLELLEAEPGIDVIIVPVGGGSGAAGACTVAKALPTSVQVIGVQSEAAPAAYRSWREGAIAEDRMGTAAEGLATRVGFELPQQILREHLDDFVLVSEDDLRDATRAHDLRHEQPRRAGGRLTAGGGAEAPRPAGRQAGRADRERREHQPRSAQPAPVRDRLKPVPPR